MPGPSDTGKTPVLMEDARPALLAVRQITDLAAKRLGAEQTVPETPASLYPISRLAPTPSVRFVAPAAC